MTAWICESNIGFWKLGTWSKMDYPKTKKTIRSINHLKLEISPEQFMQILANDGSNGGQIRLVQLFHPAR